MASSSNPPANSDSGHGGNHRNGHKKKNGQQNRRQRSPKPNKSPTKRGPSPPDMTVIVNKVLLWDDGCSEKDRSRHNNYHQKQLAGNSYQPPQPVQPYHFAPDTSCWVSDASHSKRATSQSIAVARVPRNEQVKKSTSNAPGFSVLDTSFPNPHPPEVVLDKYWVQRRRLFSRFDMGVQLDSEGWFSVTPEIIADHVAHRVADLSHSSAFDRVLDVGNGTEGIVLFDAFCGCGGNAIAFGKVATEQISLVICCDMDRSKLQKAAYNASLYEIPHHKLVFIECNTMFIIGNCYKDGELQIDKLRSGSLPNMPAPVPTESYAGYMIGGLNLLPRRIDVIFMDPPWGGVDYMQLKDGYDLEKHMKIRVGPSQKPPAEEESNQGGDGGLDDFFDSFGGGVGSKAGKSKNDGSTFNEMPSDGEYVDGVELVGMAAAATSSRIVIYDLPRNTNKNSLGKSALAAGYRGNLKLEEHYLNGRLKTVTAYMGADFSNLLE